MPSMAFALNRRARLFLGPSKEGYFFRRYRIHLMLRTGPLATPPNEELDIPLRRSAFPPTAGDLATGDPDISPDRTCTGWPS
jgi:hypothetical protein